MLSREAELCILWRFSSGKGVGIGFGAAETVTRAPIEATAQRMRRACMLIMIDSEGYARRAKGAVVEVEGRMRKKCVGWIHPIFS